MLAFANLWRPAAAAELSAIDRDQIVAAARQHDGQTHSAESALHTLFEPERWDVLDGDVARYQVWITGVDSGVVFHARSSIVVGDIIQFGFACNDLLAWQALAEAALPAQAHSSSLPMVDFSVDPDAGPTLFHLDPDAAAASLWSEALPKLAIGSAWRELAALVAPWDREIHALVTGSTRARRSPRHGVYGLASHYPAALVRDLAPRLAARRHPQLDALARFVAEAATAGHDIAVCV